MNTKKTFLNKQEKYFLSGPAGQIETIISQPTTNALPTLGIVCHPHPLYEGSMQNKVVTTVARSFELMGLTTIRFNFRGVGKSEGKYAKTQGETEDLLAIVDWGKKKFPNHRLWLAGFSFGAYIAANVANQIEADRLVTIAPPVNHFDFTQLANINCPWLVVMGDQDEVVPLERVEEWSQKPPSPLKLIVMKGASHFFHGRLIELREILIKELLSNF